MQESHSSHLTTALCYRATDAVERSSSPLVSWKRSIHRAFSPFSAQIKLGKTYSALLAKATDVKTEAGDIDAICILSVSNVVWIFTRSHWEWAAFDSGGLVRHRGEVYLWDNLNTKLQPQSESQHTEIMRNINSRRTDPWEIKMLNQAVTYKKTEKKKLPLRHNVKTTSQTESGVC